MKIGSINRCPIFRQTRMNIQDGWLFLGSTLSFDASTYCLSSASLLMNIPSLGRHNLICRQSPLFCDWHPTSIGWHVNFPSLYWLQQGGCNMPLPSSWIVILPVMYIYTYIYIYVYMYIYIYTYTYIHIHIHIDIYTLYVYSFYYLLLLKLLSSLLVLYMLKVAYSPSIAGFFCPLPWKCSPPGIVPSFARRGHKAAAEDATEPSVQWTLDPDPGTHPGRRKPPEVMTGQKSFVFGIRKITCAWQGFFRD